MTAEHVAALLVNSVMFEASKPKEGKRSTILFASETQQA